jgi:hypothetical protein
MTISEKEAAARKLADELFKGPCDRHAQMIKLYGKRPDDSGDLCLETQRKRRRGKLLPEGQSQPFDLWDATSMCSSCRVYWYAEMTAQTLERAALEEAIQIARDPKYRVYRQENGDFTDRVTGISTGHDWKCPSCKSTPPTSIASGIVTCPNGHESQ